MVCRQCQVGTNVSFRSPLPLLLLEVMTQTDSILIQILTSHEEAFWVSCLPFCHLAVFLPNLSSRSLAIAGVEEPVSSLALSSWQLEESYRGPQFTVSNLTTGKSMHIRMSNLLMPISCSRHVHDLPLHNWHRYRLCQHLRPDAHR